MVVYDELVKLAKMTEKSLVLSEDELISFVKSGAVQSYKAGAEGRINEDVSVEFNAQTKQLRLVVRKKVVSQVEDECKECTESVGKLPLGEIAELEVSDADTYLAIDVAFAGIKKHIASDWKKANAAFIKTKFQEFKEKCLVGQIATIEGSRVIVSLQDVDALLPLGEQITSEKYDVGQSIVVYVKQLQDDEAGCELIVSRRDKALVSYAMRRHIAEVDVGSIEIKSIARIPGKRSRVAVWSSGFGPSERCAKRSAKVSDELGGEKIDFIEWYPEIKAFIASSVKAELRDVHIIEAEKQAVVEVFKDSTEQAFDPQEEVIKLAQDLTGYKIEVKLVDRDESMQLPGI